MVQPQRPSSADPPAPFERPACPRCKASTMLVSIEPERQAWTCTAFSAPSATTRLRPLLPTKILCIRKPLAAGFKAICTL